MMLSFQILQNLKNMAENFTLKKFNWKILESIDVVQKIILAPRIKISKCEYLVSFQKMNVSTKIYSEAIQDTFS